MLSTPWSLGFVLAVILGAMLVPGCRPQPGPNQYIAAITGTSAGWCRGVVVDKSETRPAAPCPTESAYRQQP